MGCEKSIVSHDDFDHVVITVKRTCKEATQKLIDELNNWFPNVELLSALGIVHPQFWTRDDAKEAFGDHLVVIKEELCKSRSIAVGDLVGMRQR